MVGAPPLGNPGSASDNINLVFFVKQIKHSPPAWKQEAYRPPRSKCSFCRPVIGGGGGGSTPSCSSLRDHPCWPWGTHPALATGYPILSWLGGIPTWTPPPMWNWGTGGTSGSIIRCSDPPPWERTWGQWKYYGMEMGTPLPLPPV